MFLTYQKVIIDYQEMDRKPGYAFEFSRHRLPENSYHLTPRSIYTKILKTSHWKIYGRILIIFWVNTLNTNMFMCPKKFFEKPN